MDRHEEWIVRVALDQPTPTLFEYRYATAHKPQAGQLAHVPFGRRMETGLIWGIVSQSALPDTRRWPRLSAHLHNAQQAQPASAAVSGSEIHIAAPALTSGQAQALQ